MSGKSVPLLSWAHYRTLIQVKDDKARNWYEKEAAEQMWNVRTLQRNISSQYYYRLLKSQVKEPVIEEMKQLTSKYQDDKLEFIKNPVIAEFFCAYFYVTFIYAIILCDTQQIVAYIP